eukprot:CAMPEP_0175511778 /NCGR_PEP_ID=MMETSP0096-20121207/12071_1 /TAXON_ID=311494 /ORGANISM="Alexandrium monilatum, Strain CCMP3105" /LENGTH=396 /DNA_ID=CAMNT_0016813979 /DNA_START=50 /DNA_END=1236 /DNA_ORIENTATION=+
MTARPVARKRRAGLFHAGLCGCIVAVAVTLAGCGGGGDDPGKSTTSTTVVTTTTPVPEPLYSCHSTLKFPGPKSLPRKGVCLDDTTFQQCVSNITALWPHTDEPVRSIRMFKPWQREWGDDAVRRGAWEKLASFVHRNKATVLMGTPVTCNDTDDDLAWNWTLELIHVIGPENVMAVALGNEMELYFQKQGIPNSCIQKLWSGGRYFDTLVRRAEDMDRVEEFRSIKLTSVFGGYSKAGFPFVDSPVSQVLTYLRKAWQKYQDRWVWSFNVYPFWDNVCSGAFAAVPGGMADFRTRISAVTKRKNDTMWMTETGWSSTPPQYYHEPCKGYCSPERLKTYYESFLNWEMGGPVDGNTDHAFYFTMRDAMNFDITESFGLINSCKNSTCKLQEPKALV